MAMLNDIRKDLGKLDVSRGKLRGFGLLFFVVLFAASAYRYMKGLGGWPYLAAGAAVFLGAGTLLPNSLKGLYKAWMAMSFVMGWFMSRVILTALFFVGFMPIGLLMRLAGKDLLDQRVDKAKATYWRRRAGGSVDPARYKKQF
jgi:hypothetical protein